MTKRRQAVQVRQDQRFKGRQFTAEVILWALRWYLMFEIIPFQEPSAFRSEKSLQNSPRPS
jgi:hypothetical protein